MSERYLQNDRLLRAISRKPLDRTPIWVMRQAGRYLPEYRATRAKAGSFMQLCKTPELACEVTLQPLQRYPLDAAIIFSDILTIPDAMGLGLSFEEQQGPVFARPIRHLRDIDQLPSLSGNELSYVYEAIKLVHHELNGRVPLIGFCGSPWTLAAYMLEGRSAPHFPMLSAWKEREPDALKKLLTHLANAVADHLYCQVEAGADVVMLFDTWGGLLTTSDSYEAFSLQFTKMIIANLRKRPLIERRAVPIILFAKDVHYALRDMALSGCDVIGLDANFSLHDAKTIVGSAVALQGNLDPRILLKGEDVIERAVASVLASYGHGSGHIFNLGHGITPDVSPEKVACLVEAVQRLSPPYHQAVV